MFPKGGNEMLKKGDKVVMHTCIEAERHNGRIWTCKTDEFERNGQRLVFLEGFTGCFSAEYLQPVDLSDMYFSNVVIKGTMDDYSEQIEELQDELARWEAGLNQTKEMYELQRQLRQAQEEIERLEKRYEFASQVEYELRQEIQQLQRQLQQTRESISETLDLLKHGGPGTRSQVQALLEKALEETK
jgi:hypothetical protein